MHKILLTLLISSSLFGYYDFGIAGKLYDVKEKNLIEEIRKQLILKKDKIKKMARDAFNKGLKYESNLPYSQKDRIIKTKPVIYLQNYGKGYIEQSLESSPYNIHDSMCFVSFESFEILDKIIERFGKKCRYVFFNTDIRKITQNKKYSDLNVFVGNDKVINMFKVDSTPLKVLITKKNITKEYINYQKLKKEIADEKQKKF